MEKERIVVTALLVMMLLGCTNKRPEAEPEVKDSLTLAVEKIASTPTDSVWKANIESQITEEMCHDILEDEFKDRFGARSKILTVKDIGKAAMNHNDIKAFVEGTMQGVVRGEKNIYDFNAVIKINEYDMEYGNRVSVLQLNHKGKMDNRVDGTLLSDNTIKSQFNFQGISLRCVGMREAGVRYVTSRKMSKDQIVKFVTEETDMKRDNYYFQRGSGEQDYASFTCSRNGKSGTLYMYDSNVIYDVTISGTDYGYKRW